MQIRIYQDQLDRMPKQTAAVIHFAVKRWRQGEIVAQNTGLRKNRRFVLFSIRAKFNIEAELLRQIIDSHLDNPRNYEQELSALNKQIDSMFAKLPEYVVEELESSL